MSIALEQEAKFRLASLSDGLARLQSAGARLEAPEVFETNHLFDFRDGRLAKRDEALRLRRVGTDAWLTWKGPQHGSRRLKKRRELQCALSDADALERILEALGLETSFRYEKYRAYYRLGDAELALDRTPIGVFLEIEGAPESILESAKTLSLDMREAIVASYPRLYERHREEVEDAPRFMTFPEETAESR